MSLRLRSSGGGSVTVQEPVTASDFTINLPAATGNVFITPIPAGNTTSALLTFTPGTNLATANAGVVEYDGTTLYYTPIGTQRGIVPGMQYFRLGDINYTGSVTTSNQNVLGVGVTVSANTTYAFELYFSLDKSAGTTSHTVSLGWGGTLTTSQVNYLYQVIYFNSTTAANNTFYGNRRTGSSFPSATVITPAIVEAAYNINVLVKGTFSTAAGGGGTLIPQYKLSANPGGVYTTLFGSYMSVWPVGPGISNNSVGTWA